MLGWVERWVQLKSSQNWCRFDQQCDLLGTSGLHPAHQLQGGCALDRFEVGVDRIPAARSERVMVAEVQAAQAAPCCSEAVKRVLQIGGGRSRGRRSAHG